MTASHRHESVDGRPRLRSGLVGAGAAACAVCCAGPLLTLLGIGLTGAAATAFTVAFAGLASGVVVAAATVAAVAVQRQRDRHGSCATGPTGAVDVELGLPHEPAERARL